MINFYEIRNVHLEISSLCNASCPWCPRTFWGYPYNDGYPEVNFSLSNAKKIFTLDLLKQLSSITINGNFGDIVMNPEGADIVEYFSGNNPNLSITISTNGSARSKEFWQRLATARAKVEFCLDGLEDTHHLYRQNTSWNTVIKNAKIFIDAGGDAAWKFIKFKHNLHQIDDCRNLSTQLVFKKFILSCKQFIGRLEPFNLLIESSELIPTIKSIVFELFNNSIFSKSFSKNANLFIFTLLKIS
jgi:MoaA/NifB/PqqE/SkfB family radical SAM enzyme